MALFWIPLVVFLFTKAEADIGMSPDAVDFSFSGCRDEMLETVTKPGGLLEKELESNEDFRKMWKNDCDKIIEGGRAEHTAALQSFAEASDRFRKTFNGLVRTKGRDLATYQNEFPFKSLFFLLTDALQMLRENKCGTVFSSTQNSFEVQIGERVRFGSFLPARVKLSDAIEDVAETGGTVFAINSCSFVSLEEYLCEYDSDTIDVLIMSTEVFNVTEIQNFMDTAEDYQQKITLQHVEFQSSSNCSFLVSPSRTGDSSSCVLLSWSWMGFLLALFSCYMY